MNILFTLCGRAGSKGVKGKNARDFCGKPLVWYSMAAIALYKEKYAGNDTISVVLNTDSEPLIDLVQQVSSLEVGILHRDESLAGDKVAKVSVIWDCLNRAEQMYGLKYDMVVDLDITSPLRTAEDVRNAILRKAQRPEVDVVYSVTHARRNPYFNMVKEENGFFCKAIPSSFTTRQEAPTFYDMNASIYAYSPSALREKEHATFFNSNCDAIVMFDSGILDIDSEEDYDLMQVIAKFLWTYKEGYKDVYRLVTYMKLSYMIKFNQNILNPVHESIANYPDRNAFYIDGSYYTYRQFAERISAIRDVIRHAEKDEQIWGLALHDDLNTYASIFALWMEGKAYVPLHPSWPAERIALIREQVGCLNVLDACDAPYTGDLLDDWAETSDDDLAYILFTSGSTGVPKGVQLTRRNLAAFMDSFWKTGIDITPEDRCMQVFDLTFDVSVQSYLVALTRGACVYTVPYGQVKYLYAASLIQEQYITFGAMAPSMLTYLRPYFDEFDASSLKACILTAEACPVDLMEAWYGCAKNTEIYDFYGPTEATIYCSYYKLARGDNNLSLNGIISIGKPLANVQAIIIREDGNLVEGQEKGELCVAGDQVTPGYWKNDEKNASSFFIRDGMRYYHTGDLCYWHESGNIMYSGRIDQQAKIQGFRVELGEIEHHARQFYQNERQVIAIAFQNAQNLTDIALFVEAQPEDTKALVEYLRSKMPHYMIPTRVLFEPSFPLNQSEKVDRNALKQKLN